MVFGQFFSQQYVWFSHQLQCPALLQVARPDRQFPSCRLSMVRHRALANGGLGGVCPHSALVRRRRLSVLDAFWIAPTPTFYGPHPERIQNGRHKMDALS